MKITTSTMIAVVAGFAMAFDGANALVLTKRQLNIGGTKASISAQCKTSVLGLVASPLSSCLNLASTIPIFTLPSTSSVIPPVTDFLTGLCAAPACAEADIRSSVSKIAEACSEELASTPYNGTELVDRAVKLLPVGKEILCLKDSEAKPDPNSPNGTFCVITLLQTVQDAILDGKPLSPQSFATVFPALLFGNSTTHGLDKIRALRCSKCALAAEEIIQNSMPEGPAKKLMQSKLKSKASSKCEADKPADGGDGDDSGATPEPEDGEPGSDAPSDDEPAPEDGSQAPLTRRVLERRSLSRRSPASAFFHGLLGMLW